MYEFNSYFAAVKWCATSFNFRLDAPTENQLLLSWKKRLKTAPCLLLLRGRSVIFFSHCSFAIKFWTIFNICFNDLGESPQLDLLDWPCPHFQMCICFIVWRNIYAFLCLQFFPLKFSSFCGKIYWRIWLFFRMACFAASFSSSRSTR